MSDSEFELEYDQMYEEFSKYLKDDKFFKAFAQNYGPNWREDESICKKHYNIIYHLCVRQHYVNSGGVDVSGMGYKKWEMTDAVFFNNEPRAQDDTLIFTSEYLEGKRMKNNCCQLMCRECLGEFYDYFPSREDVDSGIYHQYDSPTPPKHNLSDNENTHKRKVKKKNKKKNKKKEESGYFEIFPYRNIMMFVLTMVFLYMLMKYMFCG